MSNNNFSEVGVGDGGGGSGTGTGTGLRADIEALRSVDAYKLSPVVGGPEATDFATKLAGEVTDILVEYEAGSLGLPAGLPGGGLPDAVEDYVRKLAASSPAMALELLLPAAYTAVGALTGGAAFVTWRARGNRQTTPLTMQHIGTGASGVGKSTSLRAVNRFYAPAEKEHEGAVMRSVSVWAERAHAAADEVLELEKDRLVPGDADAAVSWKKASTAVHGMINEVDLGVSRGVLSVYSDATAEALVSSAIEHGGAAFVRSAEQDILDNLVRYSARGGGASVTWVTDGWDGAEYRRARRGSGVEQTSAFVLSMSLLTQTETFFHSFATEGGGDAWMSKGLLGRMWLTTAPPLVLEDVVAADVRARELGPVEIPVDDLVEACGAVGRVCAPGRAARLLEARLSRLEVTGASLGGSGGGSSFKRALTASMSAGVLPLPVTLGDLEGEGVVVEVPPEVAARLEDLYTWCVRVLGHCFGSEDRVVAPVLSRLTYHLARLAGIRELLLRASEGEEALESWLSTGGGLLSLEVLEDTASRLLPWLLRMHLASLSVLVGGRAMESVRQDVLRYDGKDTSMGAQVGLLLKKSGAKFPVAISGAVRLVSQGRGPEFRRGVEQFFRDEFRTQVLEGKEGSPYVQMSSGRKEGSGRVAPAGEFSPDLAVRGKPALDLLG